MIYGKLRLLFTAMVCAVLVGILFAFARPATSTPTLEPEQAPRPAQQIGPIVEMPKPEPLAIWSPDGVITTGEYAHEADFGSNFRLYWRNYYQYFYCAIRIRTGEWAALGIPAESGTDVIYGTLSGEQVTVYDMFSSTGDFGAARRDTELGGVNNVTVFGGAREFGFTVIEFRRALSTDDQYDNQFSFPLTRVTWAYGTGTSTVTAQGQGELALLYYACPEYIC